MKTNQISNKLIMDTKSKVDSNITEDTIREILESYIDYQQEKYSTVTRPEDIYERYKHIAHESNELMIIAVVNNRNEIIHDEIVYRGKDDSIAVDIKDILRVTLMNGGNDFFLIHNHPSGYPDSSDNDLILTHHTVKLAELVGLRMIDSIIIAKQGYESIRTMHSMLWNTAGSHSEEFEMDY